MVRVIINHGTAGSPQSNWLPYLAQELSARGCEVIVPQYPTPEGQQLERWLEVFAQEAGPCTGETVLVGHSAGAAFMLSLLERAAVPVKASFFVAGFAQILNNPEFDALIESFVRGPFDWATIKRNAGVAKVYHGDNDPYVPLPLGRSLADRLDVPLTVIPGGGHLNAAFGFTRFMLLLADIESLVHVPE